MCYLGSSLSVEHSALLATRSALGKPQSKNKNNNNKINKNIKIAQQEYSLKYYGG